MINLQNGSFSRRLRESALSELVPSTPAEFVPTLRSLLGNPVYIIYLCVTILQFNSLIGMVTYKPKYIEQHYGQSASKANFLMGEREVFSASAGCLLACFSWMQSDPSRTDHESFMRQLLIKFLACTSFIVHFFWYSKR